MKPVLITQKTLAASAARAWLEAYGRDGGGFGNDKVEILRALEALGPKPSAKAVNEIIGNDLWTQVPECDACGKRKRMAVRVGAAPDYESATAHLCVSCLREAIALTDPTEPPGGG